MLSGLLHPTGGEIDVLGHVPQKRERDFLRRITLVMGMRNQLIWDIPVIDSLERNRAIYRIELDTFRTTLDELVSLLDLETLIDKPVRNLSLGERMKCEVAAALPDPPAPRRRLWQTVLYFACMMAFLVFSDWYNPGNVVVHRSDGTEIPAVLLQETRDEVLIQVDQQIDPANSGSPFLTEQGAVVGIASYKMGPEDYSAGFGVSVKELKAFISGQ